MLLDTCSSCDVATSGEMTLLSTDLMLDNIIRFHAEGNQISNPAFGSGSGRGFDDVFRAPALAEPTKKPVVILLHAYPAT